MNVKEVLEMIREKGIEFVDLKFTDVPGMMQHFSIHVSEVDEDFFEDGIGFDGSSIRGFQQIHESDMLLFPDPATAIIDPACRIPTLSMLCNIKDPITLAEYTRDARWISQKAEAYMQSIGIGDTIYFGPEAEFFVFDDLRYTTDTNVSFYQVDSIEGNWNSDRDEMPNLGYKPRPKEGYFPVPPSDTLQDVRSEMVLKMIESGLSVEVHHHEVAQGGQCEIDLRFAPMTEIADHLMFYKYIIKNIAREHGKVATFMPKPLYGDNGSGMHCHQSIWKNGKNVFYEAGGYANLSQTAMYYIGGLLQHLPALCAFIAPTTNSYKRLVPGFEAPVNIAYSQRNRSACVRIPRYISSEKATRMELRCPDPSCNPYLAFAAMLMAGLDGVANQIDPGKPTDQNLYDMEPEELEGIGQVPGSLEEALDALEDDHDFLLAGDVFTADLIEKYTEYKRDEEVDPLRQRPHPYEFYLYHDI
ncbi:MAG: type I glutamate--ammonia ligase [Planctomycetaceae bacterium]|nr:type I glutamate--ammonia ligase [Planctomycetaceae bacterium]